MAKSGQQNAALDDVSKVSSAHESDSSSEEEEDGCNTVEKIRCGRDYCKIQRKWRWMFIVVGVFTAAAVFFAIVIVIMIKSSNVKW